MAERYLSPLRIEIDPTPRNPIDRICLQRGMVRAVFPAEDDVDG